MNHPSGGVQPPAATWPSTFQAINMAVIPNGQGSDKVIVWDKNEGNQLVAVNGSNFAGGWPQRFAVGDPETNTWQNFVWTIPMIGSEHLGDLFCSGHTWLPDGRLFVVGGNEVYGNVALPPQPAPLSPGLGGGLGTTNALAGHYYGSRLAAIWDPTVTRTLANNYGWTVLPRMRVRRWYPSVTLMGNGTVLVSGGSETYPNLPGDAAFNTFEVFRISTGAWDTTPPIGPGGYPGPVAANSVIGEYPRQHMLTNNRLFMAGMDLGANRLWHDPLLVTPVLANWDSNPTTGVPPTPGWPAYSTNYRGYGASVLLPLVGTTGNTNTVMILGGRSPFGPMLSTELFQAIKTSTTWSVGPTMNRARHCANTVLLPNGEVLVIGGAADGNGNPLTLPSHECEIYNAATGWRLDKAQVSDRGYHSSGGLLPSGRVVSGGSDVRTSDYEVYTPTYLTPPGGHSRPLFAGSWVGTGLVSWPPNTIAFIEHAAMPPNQWVQHVVLMRPCSTTHHNDFDQRYVELAIVARPPTVPADADGVAVQVPASPVTSATVNQVTALPGHYLLFLVSNLGYVSDGRWVRLL